MGNVPPNTRQNYPLLWILILFLGFLFLFSTNIRAAENQPPTRMVTTADYRIGSEGAPLSILNQSQAASPVMQAGIQAKRELASLYGSEHGSSIPSRGYLSDVVWVEELTYPTKAANNQPEKSAAISQSSSTSRILYYSFNVGQWKGRLDSETTVLTRAFMTQPLLLFLSETNKELVATKLVQEPEFVQAIDEWKKIIRNTPDANRNLMDVLVAALGEKGVQELTISQRSDAGTTLQQRMVEYTAKHSEIASITPTSTLNTLDFRDKTKSFSLFRGMKVAGTQTATKEQQLLFTSNSSIYYGVQELSNFNNVNGDSVTNFTRHFFNVPLIDAKTGLFSVNKDPETTLGLSETLPSLATVGGTAQIAFFRNNPQTYADYPMTMNMITVVAVSAEAVAGISSNFFKPAKIKKALNVINKKMNQASEYLEWAGLLLSAAESTQQLVCAGVEDKKGFCVDFFGYVDKFKALFPTDSLTNIRDAIKNGYKDQSIDNPDTFCGKAVMELLGKKLSKEIYTNTKLDKTKNGTKLFICLVDKFITQDVILKELKDKYPSIYDAIEKDKIKSIELTADFLKRNGHLSIKLKENKIPKNLRLEVLALKTLANKDPKVFLATLTNGLDLTTETLKFLNNARSGNIDYQELSHQLLESIFDELSEGGKALALDAFLELAKAITPAKFVQLVSTGNKTGGLVWDWLTDPSVVKLQLQRTEVNTLKIGYLPTMQSQSNENKSAIQNNTLATTIPDIQGVRYLKTPSADNFVIDHSLVGVQTNAKLKATIYPMAIEPSANNLLVLPGFKASIENQSAYAKADQEHINQLISNNAVKMRWHVKRFNNSSEVKFIPLSQRTTDNAFNKNDIDILITNQWKWWTPWVDINMNQYPTNKIFADNGLDATQFSALDFTTVYQKLTGDKSLYPLKHKTPGIYSDYTHIDFNPDAGKLFQNTLHIYVVPTFQKQNESLQQKTTLYKELLNNKPTGYREIQLTFDSAGNWQDVASNGLWAVWRTNKSTVTWGEPIYLGNIKGGEVKGLQIPANINLANSQLLLYEDVVNGYIHQSGINYVTVMDKLYNNYSPSQKRYPLAVINTSSLTYSTTGLLKPADHDADGISDTLDDYPNDARYQFDSDNDGMSDEWEKQYNLNIFDNTDAAQDKDSDGFSNLDEFKGNTDPTDKTQFPLAAPSNVKATPSDAKVTVSWNAVQGATNYSICYAPETITDPDNCISASQNAVSLPNQTSPAEIPNLINGTPYHFIVTAEDANGKVAHSTEATATPTKPDLTSGLVAYYEFENNANDSSGKGNHGHEIGGVTYVHGAIGQAASFDGLDDTIKIDHNNDIDFNMSNSYSISIYVKYTENPINDDSSILEKWGDILPSPYPMVLRTTKSDIHFAIHDHYEGSRPIVDVTSIEREKAPPNYWHHIVIVKNASEYIKMYVNGNLVSTDSDIEVKNITSVNPLYIGSRGNDSNSYATPLWYQGLIDDLRIYNRALSETEIQTLYKKGGGDVDNSGWIQNPTTGYYYKALDNCGNWEQCETAAQAVGAHLVVIEDQAENDWVVSALNVANKPHGYWIGYTDKEQEGVWKTVLGNVATFTNWFAGEPNNYTGWSSTGEQYAHIGAYTADVSKWNDMSPDGGLWENPVKQAIIERTIAPPGNVNPFTVQAADETGTAFTIPAGKTQCTFTATGAWRGSVGSTICGADGYLSYNPNAILPSDQGGALIMKRSNKTYELMGKIRLKH